MRKCKKCEQPALPDGVLCADCRGNTSTVIQSEQISPPIHNRVERECRGAPGRASGYSNNWRNLTKEQIKTLQAMQAGRCAICNKIHFLVLDHNHKTGKVRGYLCKGCNIKLSGFDNPKFVQRATEYLDKPPANNL